MSSCSWELVACSQYLKWPSLFSVICSWVSCSISFQMALVVADAVGVVASVICVGILGVEVVAAVVVSLQAISVLFLLYGLIT